MRGMGSLYLVRHGQASFGAADYDQLSAKGHAQCRHLGAYWREHGTASRSFFLGTVLDSAALNIDIIFVGLLVAPATAGVYFNAFRTAGLLTLFMFAITLVVAPMVAHHYHAGEMRKAQAITALCAWAGFLFSLVVFAGFGVIGYHVALRGVRVADGSGGFANR